MNSIITETDETHNMQAIIQTNFQGLGLPKTFWRTAIDLLMQTSLENSYDLTCPEGDN